MITSLFLKVFRSLCLGFAILFAIGVGIGIGIQEIWVLVMLLVIAISFFAMDRSLASCQKQAQPIPLREHLQEYFGRINYVIAAIIIAGLILNYRNHFSR